MISAYPALDQRQRFCAAARTLRALARRCLLYQPLQDSFLSLLAARGLLALHRSLGAARGHDPGRRRDHPARGLEKYPHTKLRIMSDNGLQFFARDFKKFIRNAGLTHVCTSPQLSAEQREDRALAQVAQSWLHPAWSPKTPVAWSAASSNTITPCAFTRRSATSPQLTNSPVEKMPSLPLATKLLQGQRDP